MPHFVLEWWGQAAAVASAFLLPGGVAVGSLYLILSFAFQGIYLMLVYGVPASFYGKVTLIHAK